MLADLRAVLGAEHVLTDDATRRLRTRGKSTPDLLRARAGDLSDAPDAVVRPGSHDDVVALLEVAVRHHLAVVPFGGGTSVTGGLVARREGYAGVVSLDLVRMKGIREVDPVSMTAVLEPGLRGPEAEALLAEHGLTLGHYPQSFEFASIGGFAATRSSGQSSAGYGRFDAMVVGLTVATPQGTLSLGTAPATAAGPDLRQLVLGSEGAFGVITAVTVRVRRLPAEKVYDAWHVDSFAAGAAALRTLAQSGLMPTVLRLSDENETALNLASQSDVGGESTGGCLMIVGHEGDSVAARRAAVAAALTEAGATDLGEERGRAWAAGPLPRAVPPRRDARRRRARGDARDRDVLVERRPGVRRGECGADRLARAEGDRALPHLARLRDRVLALLHRGRPRGPRAARALAGRQGRRERRDDRVRRHDHAPPRRGHRPQGLAGPRDRPGRGRHPARGQGRARPDRRAQPGGAGPVTSRRPLAAGPAPRSFSFLVNPLSGGGAAPGAVVPVARVLRDAGATVEVTYSPGPLATLDLVREAVARDDVVVAVGGDGMVSSVAGEVARLGGTLGIVPAGRGNDFARMVGLPADPTDVATVLLSAEASPVDLVSVTCADGSTRVVAGSVYAGVDARAAEIVDRSHWLPRRLQYPYAAVRALASFTPASYALTVDGVTGTVRVATVVIANSAFYGSGMRIAPDASVSDGLLDVVVIGAAGRLDLIRSLPKVYDGAHIDLPEVAVLRGASVTLELTSGAGRTRGRRRRAPARPRGRHAGGGTLRAEVLPGALSLLH